jgi:cytochrome c oxidase subunit 3
MAAPLLLKDALVVDGLSRFDVGKDGGSSTGGGVPDGGASSPNGVGDSARLGLWLFLGTVSMLFIGFTSALLVRRASPDWIPLHAPTLLWFNTAALLLSSVTLEVARHQQRERRPSAVRRSVVLTGLLGGLFVAGQVGAWKVLAAQGVFLDTNPSSSFFYMLTGVHVVHVVAALIWFAVVLVRVQRRFEQPGRDPLGLFPTFWHFLAGVWAYLLFVLFVL